MRRKQSDWLATLPGGAGLRRVDELSRTITGLGIVPLAWVAWRKGARVALLSRLTLAGLALPAAALLISVLTRKDGERSE